VAIVGDDGANDLAPSVVPGVSHPFHQAALVAMGMPLLDNLDLDALARTAETLTRWTFLFVAAPLPLKDATGSPLNPLAVF
jgi:kynurenine formamidase